MRTKQQNPTAERRLASDGLEESGEPMAIIDQGIFTSEVMVCIQDMIRTCET